MTCCDYGCNQSANCPARKKLSEFDANRLMAKPEMPAQYLPKVDEPPMGYFEDFCEFVRETWRPVLFGGALGALLIAAVLLTFQPAP